MADLHREIATTDVPNGSVALWWLGQAGYALKAPDGTLALVDAYLSDVVEELYGQPRLVPKLLDPATIRPDVIIATHWHEDHYDTAAVLPLAQHSDAVFAGPASVVARTRGRGVSAERVVTVERNTTVEVRGLRLTGTFARHEVGGFLTEDAQGMLIEIGGLRLYHSGDTEYDGRLRAVKDLQPDVALICMNGSGGCMNAHEAALLAWHIGARTVYPNHFGMWAAEHYGPGATLDPALFEATYRRLGGSGEVRIPEVGVCELLHG